MDAVSGYLSVATPVPCSSGDYTEKTIAVLDLPADLPFTYPEMELLDARIEALPEGEQVPADLQAQVDAFAEALTPVREQCTEAGYAATGTTFVDGVPRTSRFGTDATGPNQTQWDAGERWMRCNLFLKLEADTKRPKETLQPLPLDVAGAANAYRYQSCWLEEGKRLIVAECGSPKFGEGAWLTLTTQIPLAGLGPYPGTEKKAWSRIWRACRDYSRAFVRSDASVRATDYYAGVRSVSSVDASTLKDVWGTDDALVRCRIPNWAFVGAPR